MAGSGGEKQNVNSLPKKVADVIRRKRGEGLSFRDIAMTAGFSVSSAYKYGRDVPQKSQQWRLKLCKKIKEQMNSVDVAKTRIIGHCLWNGSVSNRRKSSYAVTYSICSIALVNRFQSDMWEVHGFKPTTIRVRKGKNINYYETKYYSKLACQDLKRYSLTYRSTEISEIPHFVWENEESLQKEFLRTFWEDEESITVAGKIKATLKVEEILLQLKKLREKFGISCHVGPDRTTNCHFIQVHSFPENIRAFWRLQPFVRSVVERGKNCGKTKKEVFMNIYGDIVLLSRDTR